MRAYELRAFGYENLAFVERPDPVPGPLEVLVRVRAVSLNYRDHLTITGAYNPRQPLPLVPCSDGAGEIVAVGSGVARVKVGDRVVAAFAQDWLSGPPSRARLRSTLGGPRDGMLRELAVLPEHGVVVIPPDLGYAEAATLPCAALTAWNALTQFEPIRAGSRVLLLGTGGVSIFGLQFAKAMGAEVFITSKSPAKLARAEALGADHVIDYKATPNWGKEIKRLTDDEGVDVVLEVGGAGTLAESIRATRTGGLIVLIGVLAGGTTPPLTAAFMNALRLQGLVVGSREDLEAMLRAVRSLRLTPIIDRTFTLSEAAAAFSYFVSSDTHFGKVVIEV